MTSRPLRIGFLMDALESVQVNHDTTFALMLEAHARKHHVYFFQQGDLSFRVDRVHATMQRVNVQPVVGNHFQVQETALHPLSHLDAVFLRKDPPVDVPYLHASHLIELSPGKEAPFLINNPAGLKTANEKLFPLLFADLMPPTLVSRDTKDLAQFVAAHEHGTVLKPIDGYAGRGVLKTHPKDDNLASLLDMMTEGGKLAAVAQAYLPAGRAGDKRILLLNGEPLGVLARVPRAGDFRANLAAGGTATEASLTEGELQICKRVGPALRELGLYFVGVDVIGERLIEINVTSPTCLVEINQLSGQNLGTKVIEFVEAQVEARKPSLKGQ